MISEHARRSRGRELAGTHALYTISVRRWLQPPSNTYLGQIGAHCDWCKTMHMHGLRVCPRQLSYSSLTSNAAFHASYTLALQLGVCTIAVGYIVGLVGRFAICFFCKASVRSEKASVCVASLFFEEWLLLQVCQRSSLSAIAGANRCTLSCKQLMGGGW